LCAGCGGGGFFWTTRCPQNRKVEKFINKGATFVLYQTTMRTTRRWGS
jgi:hypothetical protein